MLLYTSDATPMLLYISDTLVNLSQNNAIKAFPFACLFVCCGLGLSSAESFWRQMPFATPPPPRSCVQQAYSDTSSTIRPIWPLCLHPIQSLTPAHPAPPVLPAACLDVICRCGLLIPTSHSCSLVRACVFCWIRSFCWLYSSCGHRTLRSRYSQEGDHSIHT